MTRSSPSYTTIVLIFVHIKVIIGVAYVCTACSPSVCLFDTTEIQVEINHEKDTVKERNMPWI